MYEFILNLDGIETTAIVTEHASMRMLERGFYQNEILNLIEEAGEVLMDLPASSFEKDVVLYEKESDTSVCLFLDMLGYDIRVIVKTVFWGRSKYSRQLQEEFIIGGR